MLSSSGYLVRRLDQAHSSNRRCFAEAGVDVLRRRSSSLHASQGIHHDPAGFAADEGDVRQVEAAHLVAILRRLKESVGAVQLRLSPQAGIHRRWCLPADEVERRQIPHHSPRVIPDQRVGTRGEESPCGAFEVCGVVECQSREVGSIGCGSRRVAGFGPYSTLLTAPTLRPFRMPPTAAYGYTHNRLQFWRSSTPASTQPQLGRPLVWAGPPAED